MRFTTTVPQWPIGASVLWVILLAICEWCAVDAAHASTERAHIVLVNRDEIEKLIVKGSET